MAGVQCELPIQHIRQGDLLIRSGCSHTLLADPGVHNQGCGRCIQRELTAELSVRLMYIWIMGMVHHWHEPQSQAHWNASRLGIVSNQRSWSHGVKAEDGLRSTEKTLSHSTPR
jgi:hypothetical protein